MKDFVFDAIFLDRDRLRAFCSRTETPFFLYDAETIRHRAVELRTALSFCRFLLQVPVSAAPNPQLLRLLFENGYGAVCISEAEVRYAQIAGFPKGKITVLAHQVTRLPQDAGNYILEELTQAPLLPEDGMIGLRLSAGVRTVPGQVTAVEAGRLQFGMQEEALMSAAETLMARGATGVGLHCQLGVNHLEEEYLAFVAEILFSLAVRLWKRGIPVPYCDLGGGMGWSSQPQIPSPRLERMTAMIRSAYESILVPAGLSGLEIRLQPGRYLLAPAGILVSRVVSVRQNGRLFLGLDTSSGDMLRPMMRNAYHHISILGKNGMDGRQICDVTGWLQEPGDRLGKRRLLPGAELGDICILHDAGAYCQSISTNYGGNLRCAEYLLDGEIRLIRRRETVEDCLQTLIPAEAEQMCR
ncbi:MAG: hypothetical protein VB055_07650 [Oscillospiraceae bacterium]|nr:hypothetical protein [Oscillospiraceae bacterium]